MIHVLFAIDVNLLPGFLRLAMIKILYSFSCFIIPLLLLTGCASNEKQTEEVKEISTATWDDFQYPKVFFELEDSVKAAEFVSYVPDLERRIKESALLIAKRLFDSVDQVPVVDTIDYRVYDFPGKAGKGGAAPKIFLVFSSRYFASLMDSSLTKEEINQEIIGTMIHDLSHAYHLQTEYDGDGPSVMEGLADAIRYYEGYIDPSLQKVGRNWRHGFKPTAFFLIWINENKDQNFLKKLNTSLGKNPKWTWQKDFKDLTGLSVDSLWSEYQTELINNNFPQYSDEDKGKKASKDVNLK